jgi:glycosyltransferase involved in cell wall biosynthesis
MVSVKPHNQNKAKAKVVRIISRLNVGGPARQACFLHQALRHHFETILITGRLDDHEGDMSYLLKSEDGVRWIRSMSRPVRLWSDFLAFLRIVRILRKEKPDLVHTHAAKAGTLGRIAATLLRVPVCVHTYHGHVFHGYFGRLQTRVWLAIERILNKVTDRVVAISESQADELVEKYNVVSRQKVCTIRNGYDLSRFARRADVNHARDLRREFGFDDSHFVVLWAGRLVPIKNVELLAQIVREARRCPRLRFLVVGDGTDRRKLEILTSGCTNMHIAGWRKDMPELWAAADVGLVTSRNEGTPSALIEAMASGKPFVATNVGGVIDLAAPPTDQESRFPVIRAANGFLTPLEVNPMLDCLEFLGANPDIAREMGTVGREVALAYYSDDRLQTDIETLYFDLLGPECLATPGTAFKPDMIDTESDSRPLRGTCR